VDDEEEEEGDDDEVDEPCEPRVEVSAHPSKAAEAVVTAASAPPRSSCRRS
jgi:hypothetical protein